MIRGAPFRVTLNRSQTSISPGGIVPTGETASAPVPSGTLVRYSAKVRGSWVPTHADASSRVTTAPAGRWRPAKNVKLFAPVVLPMKPVAASTKLEIVQAASDLEAAKSLAARTWTISFAVPNREGSPSGSCPHTSPATPSHPRVTSMLSATIRYWRIVPSGRRVGVPLSANSRRKVQPQPLRQEHGHLPTCERRVGAVVAVPAPGGDPRSHERLNVLVLGMADGDVAEGGHGGGGADLEAVLQAGLTESVAKVARP